MRDINNSAGKLPYIRTAANCLLKFILPVCILLLSSAALSWAQSNNCNQPPFKPPWFTYQSFCPNCLWNGNRLASSWDLANQVTNTGGDVTVLNPVSGLENIECVFWGQPRQVNDAFVGTTVEFTNNGCHIAPSPSLITVDANCKSNPVWTATCRRGQSFSVNVTNNDDVYMPINVCCRDIGDRDRCQFEDPRPHCQLCDGTCQAKYRENVQISSAGLYSNIDTLDQNNPVPLQGKGVNIIFPIPDNHHNTDPKHTDVGWTNTNNLTCALSGSFQNFNNTHGDLRLGVSIRAEIVTKGVTVLRPHQLPLQSDHLSPQSVIVQTFHMDSGGCDPAIFEFNASFPPASQPTGDSYLQFNFNDSGFVKINGCCCAGETLNCCKPPRAVLVP